ncbi:hypothetical protein CHLRE_14g626550v5 [Chlamydomonas reinhardtii]|uniref:phytol kinase n=1 Tax=Chlamydomonas reinhardtii TaxID=3055 RepID=A0A2K3CYC0_CHLRE|nr:uncharacterized protein CHLRE_14g626550v5 [Chlamydomonas reinhardtii]PNW73288.1 hypothetical protein CHLRE_14g626550v5 [Chlamydomonas reinhardtii]
MSQLQDFKAALDGIAAGGWNKRQDNIAVDIRKLLKGATVAEIEAQCPGFWSSALAAHAQASRALAACLDVPQFCDLCDVFQVARLEHLKGVPASDPALSCLALALLRGDTFSVYAQGLSRVRAFVTAATDAASGELGGLQCADEGPRSGPSTASAGAAAASRIDATAPNSASDGAQRSLAYLTMKLQLLVLASHRLVDAAVMLLGICARLNHVEAVRHEALEALARSSMLEHVAAALLSLDQALATQMAVLRSAAGASVAAGGHAAAAAAGLAAPAAAAVVAGLSLDALNACRGLKGFMQETYRMLYVSLDMHSMRCDWPPPESPHWSQQPRLLQPLPAGAGDAPEPAPPPATAPATASLAQRAVLAPAGTTQRRRQQLLMRIFSAPSFQLLALLHLDVPLAWERGLGKRPGDEAQLQGEQQRSQQSFIGAAAAHPGSAAATGSPDHSERGACSCGVPWLRGGALPAWGPAAELDFTDAASSVEGICFILEAAATVVALSAAASAAVGPHSRAATDSDAGAAAGAAGGTASQLPPPLPLVNWYDALQAGLRAARPAVLAYVADAAGSPQRMLSVRRQWWAGMDAAVRLFVLLRRRQAAARLPALWQQLVAMLPALPMSSYQRQSFRPDTFHCLADVLASPALAAAPGPQVQRRQQQLQQQLPPSPSTSGSAAEDGSSTRGTGGGCSYSLRCALDAGLLPALEQLLRRAVAGLPAVQQPPPVDATARVCAQEQAQAACVVLGLLLCESGVWSEVLAHGSAAEVVPLVATLSRVAAVVTDAAAAAAQTTKDVGALRSKPEQRLALSVCLNLAALLEQQQAQAAAGGPSRLLLQSQFDVHSDGLALSRWVCRNLGGDRDRGAAAVAGAAAGPEPAGAAGAAGPACASTAAVPSPPHPQRLLLADWAALQWLPVLLRASAVDLMASGMFDTALPEPLDTGRSGALLVSRLARSLVQLCRHYLAAVWRFSRGERVMGGHPYPSSMHVAEQDIEVRAIRKAEVEVACRPLEQKVAQLRERSRRVQVEAEAQLARINPRAAAEMAATRSLVVENEALRAETDALQEQLARARATAAQACARGGVPDYGDGLVWHLALGDPGNALGVVGLEAATLCATQHFVAAVQRLKSAAAVGGVLAAAAAVAGGAAAEAAAATAEAEAAGSAAAVAAGGTADEAGGGGGASGVMHERAARRGGDTEATADAAALASAVMDLAEVAAVRVWFQRTVIDREDQDVDLHVNLGIAVGISGDKLLKWLQRFGLRRRPRLEAVLWAPYRKEQEAAGAAATATATATATAAGGSASPGAKAQQRRGGRQSAATAADEQARLARQAARETAVLALLDELADRYGLADLLPDPALNDTDPACALVRDPAMLGQRLLRGSAPVRADTAGAAAEAGAAAGASGSEGGAGVSTSSTTSSGGDGGGDKPSAPTVPGHVSGVGLCCNPACRNLDGPSALLPPGAGKVCARCKAVRYCCGACQLEHWRQRGGHSEDCAGMKAKQQAASAGK